MQGNLCQRAGVLYVGRQSADAWISAYDLDGRTLATHFRFRDEQAEYSAVGGLAMDGDHRIWVADTPASKLRAFTLFGQQVATVGDDKDQMPDQPGLIGTPVDVLARGADADLELWVASGGVRRHALHYLRPALGEATSLRPEGDPRAQFRRLRALAQAGEALYALEGGAARVQVFRGREHHYSLDLSGMVGVGSQPVTLEALPDGRLVVALDGMEGALVLLDQGGHLQRVLAEGGSDTGQVQHPCGLAVAAEDELGDAGPLRIFCLDQDGDRVQVFSVDGSCYGAFPHLR